ncbi:hypothetical protein HDU87_003348 [Geranomyces variabilis]|uniref:F-box domain-containing protein n=1 Tax=Geranomyces variabilis TaxID=109894 RepID=A0AAD5TKK9_9FUNG|nr:hypothetical protein HDU87_003348 [Geranomyces variabilis]
MHPTLESLPEELYPQIAIHLSLFNVLSLTCLTRRIRYSLRNPAFGKRFLEQDAVNLHFEVVLATPVSGLDTFELGISDKQPPDALQCTSHAAQSLLTERTYFLRRQSGESGDAHYFRVSPSGSFRTWSESLPNGLPKCTSTPTLNHSGGLSKVIEIVTAEHRAECAPCRHTRAEKIVWWVDKQYRVFFQSWTDSYVFGERETMQISVIHQEDASSLWQEADGPRQFAPAKVQVLRYGLVQGPGRGKGLERFFGLDCDAALGPHEEARLPSPSSSDAAVQIYNPWA